MAKLRSVEHGFAYFCPACQRPHIVNTSARSGPNWAFNGDLDAPTFSPSVRVSYNGSDAGQERDGWRAPPACCHHFVRGGRIEFCADSTHGLAGKTVALPEFPDDWGCL